MQPRLLYFLASLLIINQTITHAFEEHHTRKNNTSTISQNGLRTNPYAVTALGTLVGGLVGGVSCLTASLVFIDAHNIAHMPELVYATAHGPFGHGTTLFRWFIGGFMLGGVIVGKTVYWIEFEKQQSQNNQTSSN